MVIKIGLVPEKAPATLVQLQAAAETPEEPGSRWFSANLNLGTLIGIAAFALTLIASHVSTKSDLAVLADAQRTIVKRADLQAAQIQTLRETVIPRDQYYADRTQQNATNMRLAEDEHQILLLMARTPGGNK